MRGIATPLHHGPPEGAPAWTRYFGVDYNHKVIGVQYTITGILLLAIGGSFALIFRTELTRSGLQFLDPATYNTMISMHGWVALAAILLGIGGMANYLVPLMIGAEDMAFPRLNAFALLDQRARQSSSLMMSLFYGWDGGWTVYPPLSVMGPVGYQFTFYAVFLIGLSSILGSLNLLVTIFRMRPPGMSLFRMPIFVWAIVATSLIQLTATQLIGLSFLMLSWERLLGMGFFSPAQGGQPLLFQNHVLVLLASRRLHLRAAGSGHHQRDPAGLLTQAALRLPLDRAVESGDCAGRLHRMGPPHVHVGL